MKKVILFAFILGSLSFSYPYSKRTADFLKKINNQFPTMEQLNEEKKYVKVIASDKVKKKWEDWRINLESEYIFLPYSSYYKKKIGIVESIRSFYKDLKPFKIRHPRQQEYYDLAYENSDYYNYLYDTCSKVRVSKIEIFKTNKAYLYYQTIAPNVESEFSKNIDKKQNEELYNLISNNETDGDYYLKLSDKEWEDMKKKIREINKKYTLMQTCEIEKYTNKKEDYVYVEEAILLETDSERPWHYEEYVYNKVNGKVFEDIRTYK